jgi:hypothetical protein
MTSELRERPIFICGHPKAGTSLLRAIFDSHPQLIVYPEETVFFRRFLPRSAGMSLEQQLDLADQTLIHIFQWNRINPVASQAGFPGRDYSAIPYEDVRREMRRLAAEQHRHPGDILSAAVLAFGEVSRGKPAGSPGDPASGAAASAASSTGAASRWVEKSPYNEYYTRQIFEWWPQARCLHILRDPRDNYASYRRKHPDWSAEFFSANWKRSTQAGIDNQQRYGQGRYLILRYEDLTRAPEEHLRRLAEFLEIDWNASMAAPTRAGAQWSGNSMFADQFQGISASPVARWKENLSSQDAAVIEIMTRPCLQTFRYDPTGGIPLTARWRAWSWPLRSRLSQPQKQRSNNPTVEPYLASHPAQESHPIHEPDDAVAALYLLSPQKKPPKPALSSHSENSSSSAMPVPVQPCWRAQFASIPRCTATTRRISSLVRRCSNL